MNPLTDFMFANALTPMIKEKLTDETETYNRNPSLRDGINRGVPYVKHTKIFL